MTKMLLSVVIPAHDEEGNLRRTIDTVDKTLTEADIPHEILVVNDHSTDGTSEILEWLQSKYASLRVVSNLRAPGFGNALHTGLDEYRGDAVCFVMADSSDDPQDIVAYYRALSAGADCAFGSRFVRGAKVVNYPFHKLILNRLANLFIRLLFGLSYNDVTNAFKAYRRTTIDGIRPILSHHFNITVELPLKAIVRGYSSAVTPIRWFGRLTGVSKLRIREMGSRYLFIVLYVLLEKLLSRGDYRRAPQIEEGAAPAPAAEARRSMLLPWLAFACVVAGHLLFIHTFPLNDLGGDTPGYVYLLKLRRSNLCAAPGYPFLAGLPLSIQWIADAANRHPNGFNNVLLWAQHAFDLLCVAFFMIVLSRAYNRAVAVIATLIAGLSLQGMAVVSAVYPEWLQGDLFLLTIAFAVLAWRSGTFAQKAFWYTAAFGAFTWSYLVKFNALLVLPVLVIVLAVEKLPWAARARLLAVAGGFALLNYAAFVGLYHRPRTGTADLSYDHSWVFMARLHEVYNGKLPYPQGIATKRWLALSAVLPLNYDGASIGPFENVNAVSETVRAPYRAIARDILGADDARLDAILRAHPLHAKFNLGVSSIPISWFVGLKESDDLGTKVFVESVMHSPRQFIASTASMTMTALRDPTAYPHFPTEDNVGQYCEQVIHQNDGRLHLVQGANHSLPYRYSNPFVWSAGYQLFSAASRSPSVQGLFVAVIIIGFLAAIMVGVWSGWTFRTAMPVLATLFLAAFVVFSNAVLEFRWKEMRFALPAVAMLVGIAAGWTIPAAVRILTSAVRPRRSMAAPEP